MIRAIAIAILLLFASSVSFADNAESPDQNGGRFQLCSVKIDNVDTSVLLDTRTGKMWVYRLDTATGRNNFVGLTVEGVAYSRKDAEEIDKQIHQWHVDGILDKNVKNFRQMMIGEWSYYLDAFEAKRINDEAKAALKQ
ncbi:MAG: hypothetical protein NTY34_03225 [Candidatus Omnitrophica bacterium]|nr:hypothetical protein [Candidatus Omnitrophota bacterium]